MMENIRKPAKSRKFISILTRGPNTLFCLWKVISLRVTPQITDHCRIFFPSALLSLTNRLNITARSAFFQTAEILRLQCTLEQMLDLGASSSRRRGYLAHAGFVFESRKGMVFICSCQFVNTHGNLRIPAVQLKSFGKALSFLYHNLLFVGVTRNHIRSPRLASTCPCN